jgi:predicted permease
MPVLLSEIRYGARALLAQPAWTLAAVVCIAIGTGANTASFSIVNAVLLRPLPFEDPDRLAMIALRDPVRSQTGPFALADFREVEQRATQFEHLAARTYLPVSLSAGGTARMAQAEFVTGDYFEMLRVRPLAGRFFTAEEDRPGAQPHVILSERLWRTAFASDFAIVGKPVRINGRTVTVCGVAPAAFAGVMQLIAADLWVPASSYRTFAASGSSTDVERVPMFGTAGRLRAGVTRDQARQQLDVILADLWRTRTGVNKPPSAVVSEATGFGVPPSVRGAVTNGSVLLFGLMALLVAVAIANVAGMMLARAEGRRREMAVRLALGAGALRIARPVLIESIILALTGAGFGGLIALLLPQVVSSLGPRLPEHLSYVVDVTPDWRVAIYAAASAVVIAALFGIAPAYQAVRTELVLAMKGGGNRRMPSTTRTLKVFVTGQVAVSTVLLVVSGLLVRTYLNTQTVDPGIDIRNSLVISLDLDQTGYETSAGRAILDRLVSHISAMPGVERTAVSRHAPLSPGGTSVRIERPSSGAAIATSVSPGYFDALRIPILLGRDFRPSDNGSPAVAIVNETLARRFWPNVPAVGQVFQTIDSSSRDLTVIGVAKDIKYRSLAEGPQAVFYEPLTQAYSAQVTLLVRATGDAGRLIEPIRRQVQSQNPDLAFVDIRSLEEQFRESSAPSRQRAIILASVCGIGLLLSSFGLLGVVSYNVRQRVRELGIRMALGARPARIAGMVVRQSVRLVGIGLAIGLASSFAATRIIRSVLFGVTAQDPLTLGSVVVLMLGVAVAASFFPARWATKVDPLIAIRSE